MNESGRYRTVDSPSEHVSVSRLRFLEMLIASGSDLLTFLEDHKIAGYVSRLALARGEIGRDSPLLEIPKIFLNALPKLRRTAGTLRDAAGRIVGFLQETGLFQKVIASRAPGGVILDAGNIATNAPMDQVFSSLSALRLLNGATLAATVVGIGVNVAGFALVLDRLNRVELIAKETRREAVAARLAAERVDVQTVVRNKANTLACLELAEEAWARSDPVPVWDGLQLPLLQQLTYEQCLLGKGGTTSIFLDGRFLFEESIAAYESVLLLDAARFQTLLLMGEERAAAVHAQRVLAWHRGSVFQLAPDEIARATSQRLAERDNRGEPDVRSELRRKAEAFIEKVFEIDRHLVERIELVKYLLDKGIRGRAYIEELRQRTDTPLVILPVG
jgi:hypothetical protein